MAMEDSAAQEEIAMQWLKEICNHSSFGKPLSFAVGSLCDTADFQHSYCMATILDRKERIVQYGMLAPTQSRTRQTRCVHA